MDARAAGAEGNTQLRAGVIYLAIAGLDVVALSALLVEPPSRGTSVVWLPLAALLLLPCVPLTWWLVGRMASRSIPTRAIAGGLAWAGWAAFVGTCAAVLSHVVLLADQFGELIAVLAISGAVFGVLGLTAVPPRPGKALTIAGVAVAAAVVVGSIVMSGNWGAAA